MESPPVPLIYEDQFRVHYFETDPAWRARLHTICNFFQEIAGRHAQKLGIGIHRLLDTDLTWILVRMSVTVNDYPSAGDKVTIRTQSLGFHRLYAYRQYELLDADGRELCRSMSQWVVFDVKTGKVIRPTEDVTRHVSAIVKNPPHLEKIPDLTRVDHEKLLAVRAQDMDVNRHVNNAAYVGLILESLLDRNNPDSFIRQPRQFEIAYKDPAVYGDELLSQAQEIPEDHTTLHRILRSADGKELARAMCRWDNP